MFAGTDRRRVRRERREAAADRRIGHEYMWWYAGGSGAVKTLTYAAVLAGGGWFLWTRVDHTKIAAWSFGIGIALLLPYLLWAIRGMSPYVQNMRIARDPWISSAAWHIVGLAGLVLCVAGMAVWGSVP